jgi:RNA polymerase sigma factor (sigma-70 family)
MPELDDIALLKEYAESGSESAFAELIARYVNLVYSAALRSVGNAHAAQEIAQAVFIILARKAKSLGDKTVLSGWLYQTARLTAANYSRTEIRRQHREQEAYMQAILNEPESEAWRQIAPLLDDAMGRLGEKDRNAIVLRFFENKNLREVGLALGASEDAAKMRVNRALEKLRKFFTKRGATHSAAIIAGAVSANSVHAAPVGLAKTISAVAVAKGAAASTTTLTLIKGALIIMAWTKAKTITVTSVCLILILAGGTALIISQKRSARYKALVADAYTRSHLTNPKFTAVLANLRSKVWPEERREAGAVIKSRQQVNETVNAVTIDLKPYINAALTDSPASSAAIRDNNLAELPSGVHNFGGVPFHVEGLIQLNGTNMLGVNKTYPAGVDGIAINRKCAKIYLLHGADWIYLSDFGKTVARLVLHYENGSERQLDIVAGKNVFDSWSPLFTTGVDPRYFQMAPGTERAWTGSNPFIKRIWPDESVVLYRSAFENPQPDAVVSTLDYVSTMTGTAPFLVGLTVE